MLFLTKMRGLFFNKADLYEGKIRKIIENANKGNKLRLDCLNRDSSSLEKIKEFLNKGRYDFVIHRNEHGALFKGESIKSINELSKASNIPFLSFDFGYFSHYQSYMFDFYMEDLRSSINLEWDSLSDKADWNFAPQYIQDHRKLSIDRVGKFTGEKINDIDISKCVAVWMQWNTDLLRQNLFIDGKRISQAEWLNKICDKVRDLGFTPIIKMGMVDHYEIFKQTIPLVAESNTLVTDKENIQKSNPRAIFDKDANYKLIANAKYHILLCSSVSNEIVLNDKPIIMTGRSWFNGLDIFEEPKSWGEDFSEPKINFAARNKWCNWWISRQVKLKDTDSKIIEVYNKAKEYLSGEKAVDYVI